MGDCEPPDGTDLFRMIWFPDAYDGERLIAGGVFPSEEFKTRYISVDRSDLYDASISTDREKRQREKADGVNWIRLRADNVVMSCLSVRAVDFEPGLKAFKVCSAAEGHYAAHCSITNNTGKISRSDINKMRLSLMALIDMSKTFQISA